MEVVVTSEQMRICDRYAIEKLHIPGLVLMENAGRGVVDEICRTYGSLYGKSVLIFCGKGNNGGDGFVIARHLNRLGADVVVYFLGRASDLKGDAKTNYQILASISADESITGSLKILEAATPQALRSIPRSDFAIDAIFGTGFDGAIGGVHRKAIEFINRSSAKRIAVDMPSGLNPDDGLVESVAVKADLTVTMAFRKCGLTLSKASDYTGRVKVVDIGIAPAQIAASQKPDTFRIHAEDVRSALPKRPLTSHKYSFGKIYVLAGATGYTGAAAMVANSALRSGGGMVVLGTPKSVYPILAKKLNEVIVEPLKETVNGTISLAAIDSIRKRIEWSDVLVVGPGLTKDPETQQVILEILKNSRATTLVDADGLSAVPVSSAVWRSNRSKEVILTPHVGELSRFVGIDANQIEDGRIEITRQIAERLGVTLILKGAPTITASKDGTVYINSTGNPGMATAGTGDILSGIIAGLLSQDMSPAIAAYAGVYLHGLAGDIAQERIGARSVMAMDLYEVLPDAFSRIESGVRVE